MAASLSSTSVLEIEHSKTEFKKTSENAGYRRRFFVKNLSRSSGLKRLPASLCQSGKDSSKNIPLCCHPVAPDPQPGFAIHPHSHNTGWHGWQGLGGWQGLAHIVDPDRAAVPPNSRRPNGP